MPSILLFHIPHTRSLISFNTIECSGEFLHAYAPKINEKTIQVNNTQTEKMFLQEFDDNLRRESATVTSQCSVWFILVSSKLSDSLRLPLLIPYTVCRSSHLTATDYGHMIFPIHVQTYLIFRSCVLVYILLSCSSFVTSFFTCTFLYFKFVLNFFLSSFFLLFVDVLLHSDDSSNTND